MEKPDGGPAFPTEEYCDDMITGVVSGMSLRDYFAALLRSLDPIVDKASAVKAKTALDALAALAALAASRKRWRAAWDRVWSHWWSLSAEQRLWWRDKVRKTQGPHLERTYRSGAALIRELAEMKDEAA